MMRIPASAFTLLLMICGSALAQSVDSEMAKLRELLNVPLSTSIIQSEASLPEASPIKVFIAVGQDQKIQKVFTKRLDKWNEKEGLKYGIVKVVSDISDADIILARYQVRLSEPPLSYARIMIPMRSYSYLIMRKPDKFEILWRIVLEGYFDFTNTEGVGDVLRKEFFKRMKARSNNRNP